MKEKSKIKIAKGIKFNLKILLISLLIGLISYPIIAFYHGGFTAKNLKSQYLEICKSPDNSECENILNEIRNLGITKNTSEIYKQKFPIQGIDRLFGEPDGKKIMNRYAEMYKGNSEILGLERFENSVILQMRSYNKTLDNTIHRSFGKPAIIDAISVFIGLFLIIIVGRFVFKSISKGLNWTNKYSKKEI